jgi:apolipoprotein N-acyltransferase
MPPIPNTPQPNPPPLVADLDGTLIKTDLLWESLARLLRRNPFQLFPVLFWWATRGRAFLKKKLAARVAIDPATLPFNGPFLAFLREQKRAGRKLVLATASDRAMAMPVANHVGLFDEVLGSDGRTNLRGANKLKALTEKFGERGFDYAGNSTADLAVWRGAREAIVVNASRALVKQAAQCAKLGPTFTKDYSPFGTLKSFLGELLWRSGYLTAIGAGLLLTAAFPKIGIAGFAWVAPGLMIAAAQGKRGGDAFRVGYVAGLAHFLSSLYWLVLMPVTGLPVLAWLALGAYVALFPAVWVWLIAGVQSSRFEVQSSWFQRAVWSLLGAAVWVALEMVRARLLGGFPWDLVGVSQFKMIPLIQIASVTGVYGVSFLVVWLSLALYSAMRLTLRQPNTRLLWQAEIILPLVAILILFIFGFARLSGENPPASVLSVTLVQPSIPQTLIWNPDEDEKRFQDLLALSENALEDSEGRVTRAPDSETNLGTRIASPSEKADLLLWPESAVPQTDAATCRVISRFASSNRVWIVLNSEDAEYLPDATNYFNAAYLVGPNGGWRQVYHKRKLVIFGEYVPLAHWLPFVKYLTPITGGWTPGDKPVTFELERRPPARRDSVTVSPNAGSETGAPARIKTSPLICFEDVFPGVARDAANDDTDFLVNLTNDGWFRQSAEQWQHMASAVFRAVENGVPLVRCANNGITCWIDASGRVREILRDKTGSVYGVGAMTVEIPIVERRTPTFYNRHGDWFGWGCVILAAALAIRQIFARGK